MPNTDASRSLELIHFLAGVSLFSKLDGPAMATLARASRICEFAAGEIVFSEGERGEGIYLVRSGCVSITLDTTDGRELVIGEMRPGECFGEIALVTGLPHTATAIASHPSQLVVIPGGEFDRVLNGQPGVARAFLDLVAHRLAISSERERALAFLDAPVRLARLLFAMEEEQGTVGVVSATQEGIARRVGIARQSASEILGEWRRAGWIITGRGRIMLVNRSNLHRCARQET